jgi:hypothetical protein
MKKPSILLLKKPTITQLAATLLSKGKVAVSSNNLTYLDIDDAFVHATFPLLQNKEIFKPNYFNPGSAGAHITIIYPEEGVKVDKNELGNEYQFKMKELVAVDINNKKYFVLLIDSPKLLQLRRKYSLPDNLCFKGYEIGFHITIGYSLIDV